MAQSNEFSSINSLNDALAPVKRMWVNPTRRLIFLASVVIVAALILFAALWWRNPTFTTLYANLEANDAGAMVEALQKLSAPYQLVDGGRTLMVPENNVAELRLKLATLGLPKGGATGFESFDKQKLGLSQFSERIQFQRALEGELSRSIQSLSGVTVARVHLGLAQQSGFLKDQPHSTASVLVHLAPGRTLTTSQVAGITHLVSSSVPNLAHDQVTVVDDEGRLLSENESNIINGLDVKNFEAHRVERINVLLTPLLGAENFRAEVSVEMDRSHPDVDRAGDLRRQSVAVLVNRPSTRAYSEEDMARFDKLIRQAVSFNEQRGDTLALIQSSFLPQATSDAPSVWIKLAFDFVSVLKITIPLLLALWVVVRLLRPMLQPQAVAEPPPPLFEDKMKELNEIARKNPRHMARVINQWVEHQEP